MEDWLVPKTRTLTIGDAGPIELTQSTLFWKHYDHLIENQFFTTQQIIEIAHDTQAEFGFPFPLAIQDAVGHLYNAWHTG